MKENKLYIKIDENSIITGYFICFAKTPKYRACGCNFDESKDFENAIVVDSNLLDTIEVNKTQIINNQIIG